nr:13129_t:CDS:2 [Entrophospora candida]
MSDEQKWKLQSGRLVENLLYELGQKCKYEKDIFVKSLFTESELKEIITTPYGANIDKETSENIDDLLNYIYMFSKDSTSDIREALNMPDPT